MNGQGLDDKKRPCPKQGQTLPEMAEFESPAKTKSAAEAADLFGAENETRTRFAILRQIKPLKKA